MEASLFIQYAGKRVRDRRSPCPEEIAYRRGYITHPAESTGSAAGKNGYGQYLLNMLKEKFMHAPFRPPYRMC